MKTSKFRFVEMEEKIAAFTQEERKKRLREYMRARRSENENRDGKETCLLNNFFKAVFGDEETENDKMAGAGMRRTFFIYLSHSSEAPTDRLIERLQRAGHVVCCPKIVGKEMFPVVYAEDFTIGEYGLREPVGEIYEGEIDVAVAPLLAVDRQGNRLGMGGGYYDKFLAKIPKANRIAYCYDFQVCNAVPVLAHDQRMDVIVTDKQIWMARSRDF